MAKKWIGYNQKFYSYTHPKEKILWATTIIFFTCPKGKNIHGYALKIYPLTFSAEKTQWLQPKILSPQFSWQKLMRLSARITKNLQDVQISAMGLLTKRKQAKDCDILCLLQYLFFRNRNRIVRSRFRLFCFVTVLIPVSARTHPSSAEPPTEIRL